MCVLLFFSKVYFSVLLLLLSKQIRSTLKEQMEYKVKNDKNEQILKSFESRSLIERDRQDLEDDKKRQKQHAQFLLKTTIKNKEVN